MKSTHSPFEMKPGTGRTPFRLESPEYYKEAARMRDNLESSLQTLPPKLFKRKKEKTVERAKGFGITIKQEKSKDYESD